MKKLNFKLISNSEEKINTLANYYIKENNINFKIENDKYVFNKEKLILIKKDKEKELTMDFKKKVIIIKLLSNNIKVNYSINEITINNQENIIEINYILESDEFLKNTIIIEY